MATVFNITLMYNGEPGSYPTYVIDINSCSTYVTHGPIKTTT